ncbi:MAG: TetR family transcriptional regulator [Brevibacillus sp.]|nr:TetR family transcriptional regulator [Brevibacillus sp.]
MTPNSHPAPSKAEAKRSFLIEQATLCLAQKGYSQVSLRDIAKASGVSLGILHYYFANKEDLLLAVIAGYKDTFIQELETAVVNAPPKRWLEQLLEVLHNSLTEKWTLHRLWYDLQVQAMYVPAFRDHVNELRARMHVLIARILRQFFPPETHSMSMSADGAVSLIYAQIDGLFLQSILEESSVPESVVSRLEQTLPQLLNIMFIPIPTTTTPNPTERGDF